MGKSATNFGKSSADFGKISHRLLANPSLNLGKSATDFWGNLSPTLGKSVTDFGEISHRLRENQPHFGEIRHRFLGKIGSVLGKDWLGFRERLPQFEGNWFGFWVGLRQSSSLNVLNTKHVWVWMSLKVSQPVGSWKAKMAQTYQLWCRTCFGVRVRDLYEMPQAQADIRSSYWGWKYLNKY